MKVTEPTKSEFVGPPPAETGPVMPLPVLFSRNSIVLTPGPVKPVMSTYGSGPMLSPDVKVKGTCGPPAENWKEPGPGAPIPVESTICPFT